MTIRELRARRLRLRLCPLYCHTPHSVREVVRNDECAARIHSHADWLTASLTIAVTKAGDEVHRWAGRATIAKRYEDYFIANGISSIPAPVFADEHAVCER